MGKAPAGGRLSFSGMKPIAYNYLGDLVFEDDLGARFFGRSAKKVSPEALAVNDAAVLRLTTAKPETIWLCALAFAMQPHARTIAINEFFKICTGHLPPTIRSEALRAFIVDCLHAFYRCHSHLFDSPTATALSFSNLCERFAKLDLDKAIAKIPTLGHLATPEHVLSMRANARSNNGDPQRWLCEPYFDPLDLTHQAGFALESAKLPWSLEMWDIRKSQSAASRVSPELMAAMTSGATTPHDDEAKSPLISVAEHLAVLRASHETQIGLSGRHPYPAVTHSQPATSSLTTSLLQAHRKLRIQLGKEVPDWDQHVAALLRMPQAKMGERLSAEQIDACGIAFLNFQHRKSFILADETGLGKGRTLAALSKAFLDAGRPVMFVTEKKHLFSDFWRDLSAIYGDELPPKPFLLHPKGRVLSPTGELVCKALGASKYKEQIETKSSPAPLVFTTYSQFNRDAKHSDKYLLALGHIGDGLLILDESHNASGESHTRANVSQFIASAAKCVFSSATYAKHEQAFELYESATPLTKNQMALLLSSFGGSDPLAASNAIAHGLVQIGSMVRREHLPDDKADTHIIYPDQNSQDAINNKRQALHMALESLFTLQEHIDHAKSRIGEETDSSWMKLGGLLARVSRQFNLLSKLDIACEAAARLIGQGKKPVMAMESTFESFLRAQLSGGRAFVKGSLGELDEEHGYEDDPAIATKTVPAADLSFQALFELLINIVAPDELLDRLQSSAAKQAKQEALRAGALLPDWLASPIDVLRKKLSDLGYRVGEISGRSSQLDFETLEAATIHVVPRVADDRESLVRAFNAGALDVLILTQAGASGISLHASSDFADQRPRAFIELEICANPSQRMQFLGRVRRKGQVCSPEYYAVSSGTPYEHRLIERAAGKQHKLSGLTSATQSLAAGSLTTASKIMTPKGDRVALEWLKGNPDAARRLGINPSFPINKDNGETIAEKLLKRLPLLPAIAQDEVFSFLTVAIAIDKTTPVPNEGGENRPYLFSPVLARSHPLWGPTNALMSSTKPEAFEPVVHLQEWVCTPPSGNLGELSVAERVAAALSGQKKEVIIFLSRAAGNALSTASLSSDARARVHNMKNASEHLGIGSKIRVSHPDTGRPIEGMVIGIDPPEKKSWTLYPSQWRIQCVFPGLPFELSVSLSTFFDDPLAYLAKADFSPSRAWSGHQERPYQFATLAGHCGYSRWYANQYGASVTAKFVDNLGNYQELSSFPARCTIEQAQAWKIPLIDPRLTLQLMQHDTHLSLDNAKNMSEPFTAQLSPTGGGWNLSLERSFHDLSVDFTLERRLGPRRHSTAGEAQFITRFVSIKDVHAVVTMLHNRQCRFFAPASRSKWHANALELLLSIAKPIKKKRRG